MTRAVATSPEAVVDDEGKPAVEETLRHSTDGIRNYKEVIYRIRPNFYGRCVICNKISVYLYGV